MIAAVEKQKFVYVLNRDQFANITISSPLEAHKSHNILFSLCGLDCGFDNPIFAAIELDYSDADQVCVCMCVCVSERARARRTRPLRRVLGAKRAGGDARLGFGALAQAHQAALAGPVRAAAGDAASGLSAARVGRGATVSTVQGAPARRATPQTLSRQPGHVSGAKRGSALRGPPSRTRPVRRLARRRST
jgi:Mono-functional DNA-alkylating methyl methanesulfonate N-term